MARKTQSEFRRLGITDEDLQTARQLQDAQRRAGAPVLSVEVIVGASQPRSPAKVTDITQKALQRRRGHYDQAALLLDQRALSESSPERASRAREAASIAKGLSQTQQLEFDFWRGNVSIAFQYQDAVTERLRASGESLAKQHQALAVLWTITRHLAWQSYECSKTAAELSQIVGITPNNLSPVLQLLENVGAIRRVKRGRAKVITVTPEGAFRGDVNNHGAAVEKYRLEVIEGGKGDSA